MRHTLETTHKTRETPFQILFSFFFSVLLHRPSKALHSVLFRAVGHDDRTAYESVRYSSQAFPIPSLPSGVLIPFLTKAVVVRRAVVVRVVVMRVVVVVRAGGYHPPLPLSLVLYFPSGKG